MSTYFKIKNGLNVIERSNEIVIDGIEHNVENGYVLCSKPFNHKSWGTTIKTSRCKDCDKISKQNRLKRYILRKNSTL